nr:MAG TPA: hypothetical protein [Caudoviricetes sp.]
MLYPLNNQNFQLKFHPDCICLQFLIFYFLCHISLKSFSLKGNTCQGRYL